MCIQNNKTAYVVLITIKSIACVDIDRSMIKVYYI